jgi:hypothetical protein
MIVLACAKEAVRQTSAHATTPRMKTFVVNFIGSYSTAATEVRFLLPLRTTLTASFRRLYFLDVSGKSFADKKTTIETFVRIPGWGNPCAKRVQSWFLELNASCCVPSRVVAIN